MPEKPNYQNPPQFRPAIETDELDEATLDQVVGGLASPVLRQETQMSFNLQYLQLQSQMQAENKSYTAVSNIMKDKKQYRQKYNN